MVNSLLTKNVRSRRGYAEISFASLSSWNMYAINPTDQLEVALISTLDFSGRAQSF
jgi:hypothetical protein